MNILAATQRVVIYTPAEDFFYNSDLGATFCVIFVGLLISVVVGALASAVAPKRYENAFAITAGILTMLSALYLAFR